MSLAAMAGAWLGPVTTDERAALLTAAAAASTFAALRVPRAVSEPALRTDPVVRRRNLTSKENSGRVEDLAALIAAW